MNVPRRRLIHLTALTGAALAGCTGGGNGNGNGGDAVEETSEVTMVNDQFDPRNVHVEAGTTVTWTNEDDHAHTVTSASDNWEKDDPVGGGSETTHTFEDEDVYDVYCTYHGSADLSGMSMKVAVGEATIEDPLGGGGDGGDDGDGGNY